MAKTILKKNEVGKIILPNFRTQVISEMVNLNKISVFQHPSSDVDSPSWEQTQHSAALLLIKKALQHRIKETGAAM